MVPTLGVDSTAIDVLDVPNSNSAIGIIDTALATIDSLRGDLGAVQSRMESTIANLTNVAENLSASRSRILDADIAMETSAMTRANILQQAGVSVLAQANQTATTGIESASGISFLYNYGNIASF